MISTSLSFCYMMVICLSQRVNRPRHFPLPMVFFTSKSECSHVQSYCQLRSLWFHYVPRRLLKFHRDLLWLTSILSDVPFCLSLKSFGLHSVHCAFSQEYLFRCVFSMRHDILPVSSTSILSSLRCLQQVWCASFVLVFKPFPLQESWLISNPQSLFFRFDLSCIFSLSLL